MVYFLVWNGKQKSVEKIFVRFSSALLFVPFFFSLFYSFASFLTLDLFFGQDKLKKEEASTTPKWIDPNYYMRIEIKKKKFPIIENYNFSPTSSSSSRFFLFVVWWCSTIFYCIMFGIHNRKWEKDESLLEWL